MRNTQLHSQGKAAPDISQAQLPAALLLRKCACGNHTIAGGECGACEKNQSLQRAYRDSELGTRNPGSVPPIVHEVLRCSGQPLDTTTRAFFEPRFGHDFSRVRVHADERAAKSARAVDALAYAVGRDVVFAAGQYRTGTATGRRLLAHELAHVVQQDQGGASPAPVSSSADLQVSAADDQQERYADAAAASVIAGGPFAVDLLPTAQLLQRVPDDSGLGSRGGTLPYREATELESCMRIMGQANAAYCQQQVLGVQPESTPPPARGVPAPVAAPSLTAVAGPFNANTCGVVVGGMNPAQAQTIRSCIYHANFANFMTQSVANIRQVASPYAPGLADVYDAALQQVVSAGQSRAPAPGSPHQYRLSNLTIRISSSASLPGQTFVLQLGQNGSQASNGAYSALLGGIDLNEESISALTNNQPDIERTMYHEGFHFLSAVVSFENTRARRASPARATIHPELDANFTAAYQNGFNTAVTPLWQSALNSVATNAAGGLASPTPARLALAQWMRVENEILSRVEEAIYLALRSGRGFSESDLRALPQPWIHNVGYWDTVSHFDRAALEQFLQTNQGAINTTVLPFIQSIQIDYLRRRPTS